MDARLYSNCGIAGLSRMHSSDYLPLMAQDALGNEVSGGNDATLRGIDDFVSGFLGYESKASNVVAAADADPDSVLANVYSGFTWMFLEAATAENRARVYLDRARAA